MAKLNLILRVFIIHVYLIISLNDFKQDFEM